MKVRSKSQRVKVVVLAVVAALALLLLVSVTGGLTTSARRPPLPSLSSEQLAARGKQLFDAVNLVDLSDTKEPVRVKVHHDRDDAHEDALRSATYTRVTVITVQTGRNDNWCRFLKSAAVAGLHIHTIGMGEKYEHRKRPRWILDFVSKSALRADDVIMFADGTDTVFTGVDQKRILYQYYRSNAQLLFNAEANCYHQQAFEGSWGPKKGRCIAAYKRYDPKIKTKFRYLNAGAWIGTVSAVKTFFSAVAKVLDRDKGLWCDQSVIGKLFLRGEFRSSVSIDYRNAVFLATYHLNVTEDLCGGSTSLMTCHGAGTPALVHFNGKTDAGIAKNVLQRMPWYGKPFAANVSEFKTTVNGQLSTIAEQCRG